MSSVTFIHAADLHLGAPFKGLRASSPLWADALLEAIPSAYRRIIDTALEKHVDFVVIAGDIFDDSRPSYADFSLFVSGLKRLDEANIPVYFVTGNHDPFTSWDNGFSALPSNAHLLGAGEPSFAVYERDGVPMALLGGRGYFNQAWPVDCDISEGVSRETAQCSTGVTAPFMVGVLHTGLDIDPTRSPVSPKTLLSRDVDYWACGHVHQPRLIPDAANPRIAFSGCPQGRSVVETGHHGVYLVTLDEEQPVRAEFLPMAQVEWNRLEVDVSSCTTVAEMQEHITAAQFAANADACCQRMIFRVVIYGRSSIHARLDAHVLEEVRQAINDSYPFFFIDAIQDKTGALVDKEALRSEGLFPSVYLDALDEYRAGAPDALAGIESEFCERDLPLPQAMGRVMLSLCDEAETLVLDLLGRDA